MLKWTNLISLTTCVQYVEDIFKFKFWVLAAGNAHRIPEKEIVKMSVRKTSLKPEVLREEMYSRSFETLVDIMAKTRHELANYRDIIEISERIKRLELKRDAKDRSTDAQVPRNKRAIARLRLGRLYYEVFQE